MKNLAHPSARSRGGCKDENPTVASVDAPTTPDIDAPGQTTPVYTQVEQLARPGINEAFLFTNDFNAGYNATAPSFAGAPAHGGDRDRRARPRPS